MRDGQLCTSLYDNRDDFSLHITLIPFFISNFPSSPAFLFPRPKSFTGASSYRILRLPVCSSVRLFVRNSVPLTYEMKYLKLRWWYSYQTWTVSLLKSCWHITEIPCPFCWDGSKCRTYRFFCFILTWLPPGSSEFHTSLVISVCIRYARASFSSGCFILMEKRLISNLYRQEYV